ncbi:PucR family transcriptional regulator [Streptomyces cacaoi]|uniref:PucR family transcriptional regulator n=1 Tax=Streptomyces cacaoi TaxID=1898 RepID=UPI0011F1B8F8|nr:PucR family transcriptional regulator [Streptomyces cacaoi]
MVPTVREVLALPVLAAGRPRVVGAAAHLDRPVRWVHISEAADLTDLLEGGELVLSTGLPLTGDEAGTAAYLRMLGEQRVAGLVVELGTHLVRLPRRLGALADEAGVPVVALSEEIRFVEVTQQVHQLIVADRYAEVEFARTTHEVFTSLNIARASTTDIVTRASEILGAPLVLEDLTRHVLAFCTAGTPAARLLDHWAERSRLHGTDVRGDTGETGHGGAAGTGDEPARGAWSAVPVGVGSERWGRLVLPAATAEPSRARMVLERAAQSLQLHRMLQQERDALLVQALGGLLDDLLSGRVTDEAEALARAGALGLVRSAAYVPLVVRAVRRPEADALTQGERDRQLLTAVRQSVAAAGQTAIVSIRREGTVAVVLTCAGPYGEQRTEAVLGAVCEGLRGRAPGWVAGTAPASTGLVTAARGLAEAEHVADVGVTMPGTDRLYRSTDVRLRGLVALLRDDHRVQGFAETELGRLLEHDARTGEGLLELLRAHLEAGGAKTETARRTGLSRPTLYSRLRALERVLGVSLETAESRTSLHTALMVLDARAAGPYLGSRSNRDLDHR